MLKQKIQDAARVALKSGDSNASSTLRLLLASIISREKEKRYKISKDNPTYAEADLMEKSALTDEEIIDVVSSEIKKRKEAIFNFEKGNRPEMAEKEKKEMELLQKYLPEQMPEEEVRKIIEEAVFKTGAKEIKDMGKVMAEIMPKVKGKADSSLVSQIVKEQLSK